MLEHNSLFFNICTHIIDDEDEQCQSPRRKQINSELFENHNTPDSSSHAGQQDLDLDLNYHSQLIESCHLDQESENQFPPYDNDEESMPDFMIGLPEDKSGMTENNNDINVDQPYDIQSETIKNLEILQKKEFGTFTKSRIFDGTNELFEKFYDFKKKKQNNIDGQTEFGGKVQKKKQRKNKSDDVRKKIKSRFHKKLKTIINNKILGIRKLPKTKLLNYLPQCFVSDIKKENNTNAFELTYEDMIKTDYSKIYSFNTSKQIKKNQNLDKFKMNQKFLSFINEDDKLYTEFKKHASRKYYDLLIEYFYSDEFISDIIFLAKKEDKIYVSKYVEKALDYVNFFSGNTYQEKDQLFSTFYKEQILNVIYKDKF